MLCLYYFYIFSHKIFVICSVFVFFFFQSFYFSSTFRSRNAIDAFLAFQFSNISNFLSGRFSTAVSFSSFFFDFSILISHLCMLRFGNFFFYRKDSKIQKKRDIIVLTVNINIFFLSILILLIQKFILTLVLENNIVNNLQKFK